VWRPLWREDGSVFCMCRWLLPVQSFSSPRPWGLEPVFYCLRLETSLYVASYDSQGHGGGIRPRLHTEINSFLQTVLLITSRHGPHRKHRFQCYRPTIPDRCIETGIYLLHSNGCCSQSPLGNGSIRYSIFILSTWTPDILRIIAVFLSPSRKLLKQYLTSSTHYLLTSLPFDVT
jgi:hypothetical protein